MGKLSDKKYVGRLSLLLASIYFVSYLTRINYTAVLVEIINELHITKTEASYAVMASFITYGVGQLLSGFLGDRIKPQYLIFGGLIVTSAMNVSVSLCSNPLELVLFWGINGLAQAFMWPPIVKIMSDLLSDSDYGNVCVLVSCGSASATISVYLLTPLFIRFCGYRSVFVFSAVSGLAMAVILMFAFPKIISHADKASDTAGKVGIAEVRKRRFVFTPTVAAVFAVILGTMILQGLLRDGVLTWMPTYVSEVFDLDAGISILTSVILPVFTIFANKAAVSLNRRLIKNEMLCAAALFALGTFGAVYIFVCNSAGIFSTLLAAALLSGAMHGINVILTCMIPLYFAEFGKVSFVSGLVNSFVYVGSAVSTYGFAVISDNFGWRTTVLSWVIISLSGAGVCLVGAVLWKKFKASM